MLGRDRVAAGGTPACLPRRSFYDRSRLVRQHAQASSASAATSAEQRQGDKDRQSADESQRRADEKSRSAAILPKASSTEAEEAADLDSAASAEQEQDLDEDQVEDPHAQSDVVNCEELQVAPDVTDGSAECEKGADSGFADSPVCLEHVEASLWEPSQPAVVEDLIESAILAEPAEREASELADCDEDDCSQRVAAGQDDAPDAEDRACAVESIGAAEVPQQCDAEPAARTLAVPEVSTEPVKGWLRLSGTRRWADSDPEDSADEGDLGSTALGSATDLASAAASTMGSDSPEAAGQPVDEVDFPWPARQTAPNWQPGWPPSWRPTWQAPRRSGRASTRSSTVGFGYASEKAPRRRRKRGNDWYW